jgi:hypothetical protein
LSSWRQYQLYESSARSSSSAVPVAQLGLELLQVSDIAADGHDAAVRHPVLGNRDPLCAGSQLDLDAGREPITASVRVTY